MKKVVIVGILILTLGASCSGSIETTTEDNVEAVVETNYMSLEDLKSNHSELEGKEVTIEAISWGNSNMIDGTVQMDLGSEILSGMKQAQVVVAFGSDMEKLNNVQKDQAVVIKAMVGESSYGAIHLTNPKLVSVK